MFKSNQVMVVTVLLIGLIFSAPAQDVTPGGAFTYSYPIDVPPGTNGMGPQLALSYNSMGGNGFLGVGWSLSGLSTITRDSSYPINFDDTDHFLYNGSKLIKESGTSLYYHTESECFLRIEWKTDPNTTLTYWEVTQKNGTKLYYGYRSSDHATDGTNDGYIKAVDKNGAALLWALTKVEDTCGNYYSIKYFEDNINGDYYPLEITYTKNNLEPLTKYRSIRFYYESRTDHYPIYTPSKLQMDLRLKWISVKMGEDSGGNNGEIYKKYRINYEQNELTAASRIDKIIVFGTGGSEPTYGTTPCINSTYNPTGENTLPETEFNYSEAAGWSTFDGNNLPFRRDAGFYQDYQLPTLTGDWNGDGKTDIGRAWNGGFAFYVSTGNGFAYHSNLDGLSYNNGYTDTNTYPLYIGDWNGDGRTDFGRILNNEIKFFINTNNGWIPYAENNTIMYRDPIYNDNSKFPVLTGDWNGDGRTDIGRALGGIIKFYISTGNGFDDYMHCGDLCYDQGYTNTNDFPLYIGDWNGDGRTDVGRVFNDRVKFYCVDKDGIWRTYESSNVGYFRNEGYYNSATLPTYTGDWNGDGKTDIGRVWNGGLHFYISTGIGWFDYGVFPVFGYNHEFTSSSVFPFLTGDWNGDGRTDIGRVWNGGVQLYVACASSWYPYIHISDFGAGGECINADSYPFYIGDWNGDGKTDIARTKNTEVKCYQSTGDDFGNNLLCSINNSLGGRINVVYKAADKNEYLAGEQGPIQPQYSDYPKIANTSTRSLVERISVHDGLNAVTEESETISSTSYEYYNGLNLGGKREERTSLGFEWVKRTNDTTGTYMKTHYLQDKPENTTGIIDKLYAGRIAKVITGVTEDGVEKKYTEVHYYYAESVPEGAPGGVRFIYRSSERLLNYNGNNSVSEAVEYWTEYDEPDDYGNVTKVTNHGDKSNDLNGNYDKVETVTEWATNETDWIFAPKKVQISSFSLADVWGLAKETRYFYDNRPAGVIDKGLLTREEKENGTFDVVTTFAYYPNGNLYLVRDPRTNSGEYGDPNGVTTKGLFYDTNYSTYLTAEVNALSQMTSTFYDSLMRPIVIKDVNDVDWKKEYDVFGRVLKEISPGDDSYNPTVRYTYFDTVFPRCVKKEVKESGSAFLTIYSYFDGLGREIQSKKESETANNWITVDYYYNEDGKKYKTSVAYIKTQPTVTVDGKELVQFTDRETDRRCTREEYDAIGRVWKAYHTDGTFTEYIYDKKEKTIVDSKRHKVLTEINGNVIYKKLYTGTDTANNYVLYATTTTKIGRDGQRITDNRGNILETTVDLVGRKLEYSDPDMGRWYYAYDLNGNLIGERDAKGQVPGFEYDLRFVYDKLNRLTKKDYPTGTDSIYEYDSASVTNYRGRLTKVTFDGGEESYTYDERGRATSLKKTLDGKERTFYFSYDSLDRVVSETYPGGEALSYAYNSQGELDALASPLMEYVKNINYKEYGKISGITYGNNVETTYDYYDSASKPDAGNNNRTFSYRLKSITTNPLGILNLSYSYDANDNVVSKTDLNSSAYLETYTYDDLNRLTQAVTSSAVSYGTKNYAFDELNNITLKDGYTYSYNSSKPHAVTFDGRYSYTYDANGNMATRTQGSNTRTFTFNFDNMLTEIKDNEVSIGSFSYDEAGNRTKKVEGEVTTYYFFPKYEEEYTNGLLTNTIKYYFANSQRVAQRSITASGNTVLYYHQDHLGSSVRLTYSSQTVVTSIGYMPFGEKAYGDENPQTRYQFTGQEKDSSSGLMYYGARYYDPVLGRFITPDTYLSTLNRFSYCGNNPIIYTDPTGHDYIRDGNEWIEEPGQAPYIYPNPNDNTTGTGSGDSGGMTGSESSEENKKNGNSFQECMDRNRAYNIAADLDTGMYGGLFSGASDREWYVGYLAKSAYPNLDLERSVKVAFLAPTGKIVVDVFTLIFGMVYLNDLGKQQKIKDGEKKEEATYIYRWGDRSYYNLTPRKVDIEGLSFTTVKPIGKAYVFTTMELVNSTYDLKAIKDGPTHVSIIPSDPTKMQEWIDSKPNSMKEPHGYTITLWSITSVGN